MNSIMQTGLKGMQYAQNRVDHAASSIARNGTVEGIHDPVQTTEDMVALKRAGLEFIAAVEVIKTSDRMIGSLIDIHV
jgi:flagellar hook protein FlgE